MDGVQHTHRMDRQVALFIIALLSAILLYFAIGYPSWDCNGSILGSYCTHIKEYEIVGIMLIIAAVFITLAALFIILSLLIGSSWMDIAAMVFAVVGAILAIAGVFYYISVRGIWSPVIAAIGMALAVALALILIFDYFE